MTFDPARVVEVHARRGDKWSVGSGYLLAPEVVLTACHVVEGAGPILVRALGQTDRRGAHIEWEGSTSGVDAALLRADEPLAECRSPISWRHVSGSQKVECTAVGFPCADAHETVRDTEQLVGLIAPHTYEKAREHAVTVISRSPTDRADGKSPWKGMSGAALFHQGHLIGMLVQAPEGWGTETLSAIRADTLLNAPGFKALLGMGDVFSTPVGSTFCMQIPKLGEMECGLPFDIYDDPPEQARKRPAGLLEPRYRVVPFVGRQERLNELRSWCATPGAPQVGVLTGPEGSGKTRLAIELCVTLLKGGWQAGFLKSRVSPGPPDSEEGTRCLVVVDTADVLPPEHVDAILARVCDTETRVLLIGRNGSWVRDLDERLKAEQLDLFGGRRTFAPLDKSIDGEFQAELYAAATTAFAERLGTDVARDPWWPPNDEPPTPGSVITTAWEEAVRRASSEGGDESIHTGLVAAEQGRWQTSLERARFAGDDESTALAASVMILTRPADWRPLCDLLEVVNEKPRDDRRRVAQALCCTDRLETDLLEDSALAEALPHDEELVARLYEKVVKAEMEPERRSLLSILRRAEERYPALKPVVDLLVARHLTSLVETAYAEPSLGIGPMIARALDRSREVGPSLDAQAADLTLDGDKNWDASPRLAAALWRRAVDHLARQPSEPSKRAQALRDLARWEHAAGEYERALATADERVRCCQQLAALDPQKRLCRPTALVERAALRMDLDQLTGAQSDLEEAVGELQALPDVATTPAAAVVLLKARHQLALCRWQAGDIDQGALELEELIEGCRARPRHGGTGLSALAEMLTDLGAMHYELQRYPEAADRYREAVQLLRAESADSVTRRWLVVALRDLCCALFQMDEQQQALIAITEAVAHCRPLFTADPDTYRDLLASLLEQQAVLLGAEGTRARVEARRIRERYLVRA